MLDKDGFLSHHAVIKLEKMGGVVLKEAPSSPQVSRSVYTSENYVNFSDTTTGNNILHHLTLYYLNISKSKTKMRIEISFPAFVLFFDYPKLVNQKNFDGHTPLVLALLSDNLHSKNNGKYLVYIVCMLIQLGANVSKIEQCPKAQTKFEKLLYNKSLEMMVAQNVMLSAYIAMPNSAFKYYDESVALHFKLNKSQDNGIVYELIKSLISPHKHPKMVAMYKNLRVVRDVALKARNQEIPQKENEFSPYRYATSLKSCEFPNILFCFLDASYYNPHKEKRLAQIRQYMFRDLKRAGLDLLSANTQDTVLTKAATKLSQLYHTVFADILHLHSSAILHAQIEKIHKTIMCLAVAQQFPKEYADCIIHGIHALKKAGINFNFYVPCLKKTTLLNFAASDTRCEASVFEALIVKAGADPNYEDKGGVRSLMSALQNTHKHNAINKIKCLIKAGANVNTILENQKTFFNHFLECTLHYSFIFNLSLKKHTNCMIEILKLVFEGGAKISDAVLQSKRTDLSALQYYIVKLKSEFPLAKHLYDQGVRMEDQDINHLISDAIATKDKTLLEMLKKLDFDINSHFKGRSGLKNCESAISNSSNLSILNSLTKLDDTVFKHCESIVTLAQYIRRIIRVETLVAHSRPQTSCTTRNDIFSRI